MKVNWKTLLAALMALTLSLGGCQSANKEEKPVQQEVQAETASQDWTDMQPIGQMELKYATQFTADYYEGGLSLVTIADQDRFLVVPEQGTVPENLEENIVVLQQPLDKIYLVATSAMDLFRELDSIGNIRLSGTKEKDWYIPEAVEAMDEGEMLYAGKYSSPDYELILSEGCNLAVESTMVYHNPEVKEQLEGLGIPVLVERSSYESDPLGRMEWLKLYGLLLGKSEEAENAFRQETQKVEEVLGQEQTGKTVSFFYITSNGAANIRKSGDYVAKMIQMAGGEYIFSDLSSPENALSTMNMQMEDFYAGAKDADFLIYNSAIDGELQTIDQLLEKSSLLADFKAVKEGNAWCTGKNLFQESMGLGGLIVDMHRMMTEGADAPDQLTYLHRLKAEK